MMGTVVRSLRETVPRELRRLPHRWEQFRRRLRHRGAVARPYELIDVVPGEVDYLVSPRFLEDVPADATHIVGGEWDRWVADSGLMWLDWIEDAFEERGLVALENYGFYRSVEDHFRRGVPWEETVFYDWATTAGELPETSFYANEESRQWRFDQLDRLADSMTEEGYRTQRECAGRSELVSGEEAVGTSPYEAGAPPEYHEVTVDIGRDGEVYFEEGRHRFSVARALELDSIPVRVLVRHDEWQAKRSAVARATSPDALDAETRRYLSHPDMADVATFDA